MSTTPSFAALTADPVGAPFVLGANYWPRRKAMAWWKHFDAGEVRDEFAQMHDLGLTLARIFLLWEDFQPTATTVSDSALRDLVTVADAAHDIGLGLDVTFFTGHMSGPNWAPGWLLAADGIAPRQVVSGGATAATGYRNPYTHPDVWDAQHLLLARVIGALAQHPAVALWNLGNEPDLFALPPDRATGVAWLSAMTDTVRAHDRLARPVTCGLHAASLMDAAPHRVQDTFRVTDVPVMHSYPMYTPWAQGPLDPEFVPYTCALTSALCGGTATLMEEFGGPTLPPGERSHVWTWDTPAGPRSQFMASEEDFAAYIEAVLPRLLDVGTRGALLWCFADYHPDLWGQPPCDWQHHERHFGLVRPDGSVKPHADVVARFATLEPTVRPATRTVPLDVTPDAYDLAPAEHAPRLYRAYLDQDTIA